MGRLIKMEEPASDEFCAMLRHAILAGCCRIVARREPGSSRVLLETADKHSMAAATALERLMSEPGLTLRLAPRRR